MLVPGVHNKQTHYNTPASHFCGSTRQQQLAGTEIAAVPLTLCRHKLQLPHPQSTRTYNMSTSLTSSTHLSAKRKWTSNNHQAPRSTPSPLSRRLRLSAHITQVNFPMVGRAHTYACWVLSASCSALLAGSTA
jgi:hypothetical protein